MAQHRKSDHYHHGNLKEACIKEGVKLLDKNGPDQLSLRDISRRLKVSPGAPYRHFKSKEHLLAAIAGWGFRELEAFMQAGAAKEANEMNRLRAMGHSFLHFAAEHPEVFKLMFSGLAMKYDENQDLKRSGEQTYGMLYSCVDRLIGSGTFKKVETNRVSVHALAMIYGYSMLILNGQLDALTLADGSAQRMLDDMTDDMVQGLGMSVGS